MRYSIELSTCEARRPLSSIERVFSEQAKDSEKHLRERIESLKANQ
jgi:hypothetical protein